MSKTSPLAAKKAAPLARNDATAPTPAVSKPAKPLKATEPVAKRPAAAPVGAPSKKAASSPTSKGKAPKTGKPADAAKPGKAPKPLKTPKATKALPPAVPVAQGAKPAKTATAKPAAKKLAKPAAADTAARPKLVRDSFTMPKGEYAVLETLKRRAAKAELPSKKSELLRAGLKALAALDDAAFAAVLKQVPSLKTGRPGGKKKPA